MSGRRPLRVLRYRRVRRGGMASVISRMSTTSWRSSAGDSSVKSRPRSRSAAEATRRMAGPSASGSSPSAAAGSASDRRSPSGRPPGSPRDWPEGGGPPSGSARWNLWGVGSGGRLRNGDGPPNSAAKTRSKTGIWLGSDTIVASAQAAVGQRGGAHDRQRAGQPLAPVRADREPRRVQGDPQPGGHRGHVGAGRRGQGLGQGRTSVSAGSRSVQGLGRKAGSRSAAGLRQTGRSRSCRI